MFAKISKADIIGVTKAPEQIKNASLSKLGEMSFGNYLTDQGFLYVRVRAISSRINRNHDGWPAEELAKSYRTFVGKPIFVDHHNHDPKRARGVVVDAELHIEDAKTSSTDAYYSSPHVSKAHLPATWVELLLEVDAKKYPKLARAIISGEIDSVSMGADVGFTVCSHCGHKATDPAQFCRHITSKGAYFDKHLPNGQKISAKSYEDCHKISFFEISFVFDPADETALVKQVKQAAVPSPYDWNQDEGGLYEDPQYDPQHSGSPLSEDEKVNDWRMEQFVQMGYSPEQAASLAESGIDHHALGDLIGKGATPDQAHQIIGSVHLAEENPLPQSEMSRMPENIDTLRQEDVCPVCGDDGMEDGQCGLCGYVSPPEGFSNPDLTKAKEIDKQLHEDPNQNQDGQMDQQNEVDSDEVGGAPDQMTAVSKYRLAHVTTSTDGTISVRSRTAAATNQQPSPRINIKEKPLLPPGRQNSDLPLAARPVKQPTQPMLSNLQKDQMTNVKTADGATPWGEGTSADNRVDVLDVGAVAGDPLSGIKTEDIGKDTGDFVAPHTKTWTNGEGDSLGQHDPVTSEPFEGAGGNGNSTGNAVGVSSPPGRSASLRISCDAVGCSDDKPCEDCKDVKKEAALYLQKHADSSVDLGGPIGEGLGNSGAANGVSDDSPSAPGFPDSTPSRVDVTAPLAEEIGDHTKTFGTDDFHITDPVTKDNNANDVGGPIGTGEEAGLAEHHAEHASSFGFAVKAMKLAETEAALGLTADKWQRVAELEGKSDEYISAQLETLSKVKTAGFSRTAARKPGPGRLPSLSRTASAGFEITAHAVSDADTSDSLGGW